MHYFLSAQKHRLWVLAEAVLTSTHNLCFEQKYEIYQIFLFENFMFFEVKFSIYLNRRVFVMCARMGPVILIVTFNVHKDNSTVHFRHDR